MSAADWSSLAETAHEKKVLRKVVCNQSENSLYKFAPHQNPASSSPEDPRVLYIDLFPLRVLAPDDQAMGLVVTTPDLGLLNTLLDS